MTPRTLTSPLPIRGDVPGLLCRGMPVLSLDGGEQGVVTDASEPWLPWVAYCDTDGRRRHDGYTARSWNIDWSSPLALYAALHWLSGRGHDCWWMRPAEVGGRTADWNEAAILVSVSVGRVVAGLGPVARLLGPSVSWTASKLLRSGRRMEIGHGGYKRKNIGCDGGATHIDDRRWFYGGGTATTAGGERDWRAMPSLAEWEAYAGAMADAAAVVDGSALRVEGGVMVGVAE